MAAKISSVLVIGLMGIVSQPAFSQVNVTKTGPEGNGVTKTVEKKCTKTVHSTKTGPDGKTIQVTREIEVPCNR